MSTTTVTRDDEGFTVVTTTRYEHAGLCPVCRRETWREPDTYGRLLLLSIDPPLMQPHYAGVTCSPPQDALPFESLPTGPDAEGR